HPSQQRARTLYMPRVVREDGEEVKRTALTAEISEHFAQRARPLVRSTDFVVRVSPRSGDGVTERELELRLARVPLPALSLHREERARLTQVPDRLLVGGALARLLRRSLIAVDRLRDPPRRLRVPRQQLRLRRHALGILRHQRVGDAPVELAAL